MYLLGDLTIRNLRPNDAMEYSVQLISTGGHNTMNKIKLVVKRKCQVYILKHSKERSSP